MANELKMEPTHPAVLPQLEGSLLDEILAETKMKPSDEAYAIAKKGVAALVTEMLAPAHAAEKVDRFAVDAMIAEIDKRLGAQVNEILHHPDVQRIESAWRSLRFVVERVDFRENTRVGILSLDKESLQADLDENLDLTKTGFYRVVYSNEYGALGGRPFGVMNLNYDFGPGPQDMEMLRKLSAIASMAHVPLMSNASPEFFGDTSFRKLPNLKDLSAWFEGPQYARWRSFREMEDSRYVGLCLPRFLLRLPYGEKTVPVKSFNFNEDVIDRHDRYLWGYASNALITRIAESFAKYRWAPNIIGPQAGGAVESLPLHQYQAMGEIQTKMPTEVLVTLRREYELSEEGFISLVYRKEEDNACFLSANSAQKPKFFGNSAVGKEAETNYRLGTQLPYMFIVTRLAHYIKKLQGEQIGSWKERATLQRELNTWISQYVADMEDPSPAVRSKRPLRQAQVTVEDVEGEPGWYRCSLMVRPHFKFMGASFTLSLVGKLDKK
jgi:type VI secretion system protein ImpC